MRSGARGITSRELRGFPRWTRLLRSVGMRPKGPADTGEVTMPKRAEAYCPACEAEGGGVPSDGSGPPGHPWRCGTASRDSPRTSSGGWRRSSERSRRTKPSAGDPQRCIEGVSRADTSTNDSIAANAVQLERVDGYASSSCSHNALLELSVMDRRRGCSSPSRPAPTREHRPGRAGRSRR